MEQTIEKPGTAPDSILTQMLQNTDLWDYQDADEQQRAMDSVLAAEIKAREIPLRIEEAKRRPDDGAHKAQIEVSRMQAASLTNIAKIQCDAAVRQSMQPYRWRSHIVWAITAAAIAAMVVADHSGIIAVILSRIIL